MACDALLQTGGLLLEVCKGEPVFPFTVPASHLARTAVVESKQKCVVFCEDLINTMLSSLYGQARLYYSHDK